MGVFSSPAFAIIYPSDCDQSGYEPWYEFCWQGQDSTRWDNASDYIVAIQRGLNGLGFNTGTVDGLFGTNTKNGVKAYQTAYGLTADGVFGQASWIELHANLDVYQQVDGYLYCQMGSSGACFREYLATEHWSVWKKGSTSVFTGFWSGGPTS
jgi:hypothetical protein